MESLDSSERWPDSWTVGSVLGDAPADPGRKPGGTVPGRSLLEACNRGSLLESTGGRFPAPAGSVGVMSVEILPGSGEPGMAASAAAAAMPFLSLLLLAINAPFGFAVDLLYPPSVGGRDDDDDGAEPRASPGLAEPVLDFFL